MSQEGYLDSGDAVATNSSGHHGEDPFLKLYPAIVQCFTIILLGYISARARIINHTQASGIGTYLTRFALPALLFQSMAEMKFREVKVMFLVCIFIVKCTVYFLVFLLTVLITKPRHYGKVGIYSIFVTQGNDIALGYPIVSAVYGSQSEYSNYLYLIQPINMVLLNPLGLTLLEIHKWKRLPAHERQSKWRAVLVVIKGIVLNPIITMTALGVVMNLILTHGFHRGTVPTPAKEILLTLGESFSAGALFYLGYNMMGKMSSQNNKAILTIVLLLCTKLLLMPVLLKVVTAGLLEYFYSQDVVKDLSSFAFLYGTFPTAPAVFLFAFSYGVAQSVISTGVVVGTFISAPIMFVSTKVATIKTFTNWTDPKLLGLITETGTDVSIITIICTTWVLITLAMARRIRSLPHQFTACMALCQCLSGLFLILFFTHHSSDETRDSTVTVVYYGIYLFFMYAGYSWMAVVSMAICGLGCKSLCYLLRKRIWLYLYGWSVPAVTLGIMVGFSRLTINKKSINPATDLFFPLGKVQLIVSVVYLLLNVAVTLTALILLHRHDSGIWGRSQHSSEVQPDEWRDASAELTHTTPEPVHVEESTVFVSEASVPHGILKAARSAPNPQHDPQNNEPQPQPAPQAPESQIPHGILTPSQSAPFPQEEPQHSLDGRPRHDDLAASSVGGSTPRMGTPTAGSIRSRKRVSVRSRSGPNTAHTRRCHQSCGGETQVCDMEDLMVSLSQSTRSLDIRHMSSHSNRTSQEANEQTPLLQAQTAEDNMQELSNHVQASFNGVANQFADDMCPPGSEAACCNQAYGGLCHQKLERYFKSRFYLMTDEERCIFDSRDEHQLKRHILMVIILLIAAICELLLCIWRLSRKHSIYVELEFINMAFLAGQGIFAFGIFGFDAEMVVNPLYRKLRKLVKGKSEIDLPLFAELDEETQRIVESFIDYHQDSCRQDIARCHWHKLRRYQFTFYGHELIDWLIDRGLANEREDALLLGSRLLNGKVIEHVHKEQFFHDLAYLYQFVPEM